MWPARPLFSPDPRSLSSVRVLLGLDSIAVVMFVLLVLPYLLASFVAEWVAPGIKRVTACSTVW